MTARPRLCSICEHATRATPADAAAHALGNAAAEGLTVSPAGRAAIEDVVHGRRTGDQAVAELVARYSQTTTTREMAEDPPDVAGRMLKVCCADPRT